jgi:cysteinyl-tRNA synthetase
VRAWAIQLHGYEREGAVERLATSPYELLVLDAAARPVAGKLCLAYVNVGQAESYRPYWKAFWRAPAAGAGVPDYLLAADPQGWQGNYVVAYWDPRWQALLWGGRGGQVDEAIAAGFDGVFLDWVLGARDLAVTAAARRQGVDAERAMAGLVRDLAAYARSRRPGFLVVANNGALLAARFPGMRRALDAVVQESLTYGGRAGAAWEDGDAGGLAPSVSPETRAALASVGLPVFTLDYAVLEDDARTARAASLARGFVPFVSRTSLDRLP